MSGEFPRPLCALCGRNSACAATGRGQPDYPACRRPLLGVPVASLRALADAWAHRHGPAPTAVQALLDALSARYAGDGARWSEIFEPSLAWDEAGVHARRCSYAFPGFAGDETAAATIASAIAPFGDAAVAIGRAFLRAARHPAVAQPLIGVADEGARGVRLKLYLQFRDDADGAARAIAAATTGVRLDALSGRLHMLGLDVSQAGLRGAKLYVVPSMPPSTPLVPRLRHGLWVHRLDGPHAAVAAPSDLDFGLAENELTEAALETLPLADAHRPALQALAELRRVCPLAVRRVSLALPPARRLVLYYAPTGGAAPSRATGTNSSQP